MQILAQTGLDLTEDTIALAGFVLRVIVTETLDAGGSKKTQSSVRSPFPFSALNIGSARPSTLVTMHEQRLRSRWRLASDYQTSPVHGGEPAIQINAEGGCLAGSVRVERGGDTQGNGLTPGNGALRSSAPINQPVPNTHESGAAQPSGLFRYDHSLRDWRFFSRRAFSLRLLILFFLLFQLFSALLKLVVRLQHLVPFTRPDIENTRPSPRKRQFLFRSVCKVEGENQ